MGTESRRQKASMKFQKKRGYGESVAVLATMAIMPLDDAVRPNRDFEKAARMLSRRVAHELRGADEATASVIATDAVRDLRSLANGHFEPYYVDLYNSALKAAATGGGNTAG